MEGNVKLLGADGMFGTEFTGNYALIANDYSPFIKMLPKERARAIRIRKKDEKTNLIYIFSHCAFVSWLLCFLLYLVCFC